MTQYRIIERLNDAQEWQPDGIAYMEEEMCLFYRRGQIMRQSVTDLAELRDGHFPYEKGSTFRWGPIKTWEKGENFEPEAILKLSFSKSQPQENGLIYQNINELPSEIKHALLNMLENINMLLMQQQQTYINILKQNFVNLHEKNLPPYQELVEFLWRCWTFVDKENPPFSDDEHNVALLLYAKVFGLPVDENPIQSECLNKNKHLYQSLSPPPRGWGARASLSKEITAMFDSPVIHVWVIKNEDIPERLIIVGKGLSMHREKIFSDALTTAIRVQASPLDIFNDGLIDIRSEKNVSEALDVLLPVLGANAPLEESETAEAAMRELIRQLRNFEDETGFVQIHECDIKDVDNLEKVQMKGYAKEAKDSGEPILWAPDPNFRNSKEELVANLQIYNLSQKNKRVSPFFLSLSPQLLTTKSCEKLFNAYYKYLIYQIQLDASIRLDFYKRRADALSEDKKQWDNTYEDMRLQRWGPTITLNQRFDDETGLTIWLQPPEIISTKKYYEENVPSLIQGYKQWAKKMQSILDGLRKATERRDAPFQRLIRKRFFDAALRERDIEVGTPKIQELYQKWAIPMGDLLRFKWRKKLSSMNIKETDLFTAHTTFNLVHFTDERKTVITELRMTPYTFFDARHSVVLFDSDRHLMIVNDASDFPIENPSFPQSENLRVLLEQYGNNDDMELLVDKLRERLIQNPQQTSKEIIALLSPQATERLLAEDSDQIHNLYEQGLRKAAFPRYVNYAEKAMSTRALLSARESLEKAQNAIPDLLDLWNETRQTVPEERRQHLPPIPERNELECRLHLLTAIAECVATDLSPKEHLLSVYHTPQAGGRIEIRDALAAADNADPQYTSKWIEYLSQWDMDIAFNKLVRNMPSEQDLTSFEQHSAIRVFDAIELMHIAKDLHKAMATLSHVQETRATALIKLGPALERAILSNTTGIAFGDLKWLLEILIGRQVGLTREGYES